VFASPSVRRFAREVGVDITNVEGTGPGGRISEDDVKSFARTHGSGGGNGRAAVPSAGPLPDFAKEGPVERESLSMIAKKTAEHMALCWSTIPHVTLNESVDSTDFEAFRQANNRVAEKAGGKLTPTAMLVKVVVEALKKYPICNCSYDAGKQELIKKGYYHIGVAADTPRGLVVPVIRNSDQKSLVDIAVELGEMAEKARKGKLALEDMTGGTFTITNLGGIGVGHFTPIVNHPEVAILGVGTARETEGKLMMPLSLSFDHRVVNGADGARFLTWIKNAIEQPLGALLGL
jgi:pyruvate dehydrogenase E2 component (dihydrolipoamide acetyltransferase)